MADVVASQVSVRDLKTHLSEWLARAQAGEVVEVTSHRKPIARLTGMKQPGTTRPTRFRKPLMPESSPGAARSRCFLHP